GAVAEAALSSDRAAMHLHQLANQCEPDPAAFVASSGGAFDTAEALEKVRHVGFGNAGTGVADGHPRMAVRSGHRNANLTVEGGFQRVGKKVEHDLLPHLTIDIDRLRQWRAIHDQLEARTLHGRTKDAGDMHCELRQVGGFIGSLRAAY